jgi:Aldehyde dehydrogenase family
MGGHPIDGPGFFYAPALLTHVDPDSEVAQDELFGPVLVVIPFSDDDDAVRIANNSIFGLSGASTAPTPTVRCRWRGGYGPGRTRGVSRDEDHRGTGRLTSQPRLRFNRVGRRQLHNRLHAAEPRPGSWWH